MQDIRWQQRFNYFRKALQTLRQAVELAGQRELTGLEKLGLIHGLEFTHELAWNVMKDYLEEQGVTGIIGSKNATREAFRNGLLNEGQAWMDMIKARNPTLHTYNTDIAEEIASDILTRFYPAFAEMEQRFSRLRDQAPDGARTSASPTPTWPGSGESAANPPGTTPPSGRTREIPIKMNS